MFRIRGDKSDDEQQTRHVAGPQFSYEHLVFNEVDRNLCFIDSFFFLNRLDNSS